MHNRMTSDRANANFKRFVDGANWESVRHSADSLGKPGGAFDAMPAGLANASAKQVKSAKRALMALDAATKRRLLSLGLPMRAFDKGGALDAENDDPDENDGDGDLQQSFQELWKFMVLNAPDEARDLMRDFVSKAGLSDKLNVAEPDDEDGETAGDNYKPMPPGRRVALRAQAGDSRARRLADADYESVYARFPGMKNIKVLG